MAVILEVLNTKKSIVSFKTKGSDMFNDVDKELEKIGFIKFHGDDEETSYGVCYKRKDNQSDCIQRLDIYHKHNGRPLIMSYQEGLNSDNFNNCYGLTYKEMKLAMKKYKQMKRKYKWI